MLDPARSGGGTTLNLSVHYIDLFRYFLGEEIPQAAGLVSNLVFGEAVEDHSVLLLRSESGAVGVVETGYVGTACPEDIDRFELMTEKREMVFDGKTNRLRWWDRDGAQGVEALPEVRSRAVFVRRVLEARERSRPPPATLDDAVAVLDVVDRVRKGENS
jgi:predicted dehydrogenase